MPPSVVSYCVASSGGSRLSQNSSKCTESSILREGRGRGSDGASGLGSVPDVLRSPAQVASPFRLDPLICKARFCFS